MTKVKVTLDKRADHTHKDGKFPLVLRLSHKRKTRDIPFDIYVHQDQFDETEGKITGIQNAVRHSKRVQNIFSNIDLWVDENKAAIKLWEITKLKDQIERRFFKKQSELRLFEHAADLFNRFWQKEKYSTIASYEDALKVLAKYNMHKSGKSDRIIIKSLFNRNAKEGFEVKEEYQAFDLPIKAVDKDLAKNFEAYMSSRFKSKNSVFIHLRSLQSIISDAEDSYDELKGHKPFAGIKKVSLPNKPVVLTRTEIDSIRKLKAEFKKTANPKFDVINYFLFMFNNMGMNFMDLALAKVSWFDGERFNYTRKKTEEEGDDFSIKQNEENLKIIKYYRKGKSKDNYLFPIIPEDTPDERIFLVKKQKAKWFNDHFTDIANRLEIDKNITTYTPRDTWTNMGLSMGIDIRKISKGLGHARVETTEKHYEQNMQFKLLDEMNDWITDVKEP